MVARQGSVKRWQGARARRGAGTGGGAGGGAAGAGAPAAPAPASYILISFDSHCPITSAMVSSVTGTAGTSSFT